MISTPSAIVFVNQDISDGQLVLLKEQLMIHEAISKQEFDARMIAVPEYPQMISAFKHRVLVILPTFQDFVNRDIADLVLFIRHGLANVEKNNFGPHGLSVDMRYMNLYSLLRYNKNCQVVQYSCSSCCSECSFCCDDKCGCKKKYSLFYCGCKNDKKYCPEIPESGSASGQQCSGCCRKCGYGLGGIFQLQNRDIYYRNGCC